jgi:GntR family transcriptional regulator
MFELDIRSRKPIYEQLLEKLKEMIIRKELEPDEKLPSVRTLSQELSINPNTIQKAYRELEQSGYIYTIQGKGNFVAPRETVPNTTKLTALKKEISPLLAEAIFLGLTEAEWRNLYQNVTSQIKGGNSDDSSETS